MEQPLSRLEQVRFVDAEKLVNLAQLRYRELLEFDHPVVFLCDRDSVQFIAGFVAACSVPCRVFLCNPDWGETEWRQVFELAKPGLVWGDLPLGLDSLNELTDHELPNRKLTDHELTDHELPNRELTDYELTDHELPRRLKSGLYRQSVPPHTNSQFQRSAREGGLRLYSREFHSPRLPPKIHAQPLIMIPTGGTSGKIRFAMHTWETLSASVQGFRQYFEVDRVNSLCVLPLYHVSGLMQFLRSFLTNGSFVLQSWKDLNPEIDPQDFFLSLVPTQLQQLLIHSNWLARFKTILLGGAPAWSDLLQEARSRNLPIAPTYGMTETASQIVTLKPADFLNGIEGCGRVLPHAEITIVDQKLSIRSKSLMLGYYPNLLDQPQFDPDDLGYFDDRHFLHLIGRNSNKIISGGENVFPAEVESAIRSTNLVQDIHVLGTPDPIWGQSVMAIYVPCDQTITIEQLKTILRSRLTPFKQPKYWIKVDQIPRTAQGKISRDRIAEICKIFERSFS